MVAIIEICTHVNKWIKWQIFFLFFSVFLSLWVCHTHMHTHTHIIYIYTQHIILMHTCEHNNRHTYSHILYSGKILIIKHRPVHYFFITKIDLVVRCILPSTQFKVTYVNIRSQTCFIVIKSNAHLQIVR